MERRKRTSASLPRPTGCQFELIADSLTAAQLAAVTHVDGPLLILAGPGSGKTRVVTHRIAHLLAAGHRRQQILALTFTNKAADEMKARLGRLVAAADGLDGHVPPLLRPAAADVRPARRPGRELLDLRHGRQPPDAGRGDRSTNGIDLTHATPDAHRARDQLGQEQPDGARTSTSRSRGHPLGGIVAAGLSGLSAAAAAGQRGRFRRPAAARRHAAPGEPRGARAARRALPLHPGR